MRKKPAFGETILIQGLDQILAGLLLLLSISALNPGLNQRDQFLPRLLGRKVLVQQPEGQGLSRQTLPIRLMLKALFKVWG